MGFCLTLTSVFQSIAGLVRSNQLLRFGFDTISKSNSPVGSKFGLYKIVSYFNFCETKQRGQRGIKRTPHLWTFKKSVAVMVRTMIEEVCFKIRTFFIAAIHNWT